jgi:hypothetical protein
MTKLRCIFCALAAATLFFLSAAAGVAGELQLSIANGKVTLIADNVSPGVILAEWARIGQTKFVNAEKVTGPPVTLRLIDVPERQALDLVLRSASGYMAAPRALGVAGTSQYDRILNLASSRPTVSGPAPAAGPSFPGNSPRFQPPPMVQPVESEPDDQEPDADGPAPGAVPAPVMTQPGFMPAQVPPPGATQGFPLAVPGQDPNAGQVTAPVTTLPRPGQLPQPPQPQGTRPIP